MNIYGSIADFSKAINAPPSYLEENIQAARSFAMAISCLEGLSYYQFLADWNDGVNRLLIRIANSVSLYRENPQQIKVDIENNLIRPIFEIEIAKRRKQQELLTSLSNRIDILTSYSADCSLQIYENKQAIESLYELKLAPKLQQIEYFFETWKQDVYTTDKNTISQTFFEMFLDFTNVASDIAKVLGLLDYGGDLLLRIDKLSEAIRIEQEEKVADVSTRRFKELIPNWLSIVKEKTG
jgi:hypothetical protein